MFKALRGVGIELGETDVEIETPNSCQAPSPLSRSPHRHQLMDAFQPDRTDHRPGFGPII